MICTCIAGKDYSRTIEILKQSEMAEIRLDLCSFSDDETEDIFANSETPLIATCRCSQIRSANPLLSLREAEAEAERRLSVAIKAGARYADLEIEASSAFSKRFQKLCHENGVEIIRSYHNFESTPEGGFLGQIVRRCFRYGADIAKIAVYAQNDEDCDTIAALYENIPAGKLAAFAMGEKGRKSRIDSLKYGAPFCYAALAEGDSTAPGQQTAAELKEILYRGRSPFEATGLRMPASKSFAQRAIIAAALAEGESTLRAFSPCDDTLSAIKAAEALGASVRQVGKSLVIRGIGPLNGKLAIDKLDAGESGLLARLLIPLAAQICEGSTVINGRDTLIRRPLKGAAEIMAAFGVILSNVSGQPGTELRIPVKIKGKLIPGTADISGAGGSQLISGLLMALPLCDKPSTIYVNEPKSIPYMYMTLDVMRKFGVGVRSEMEGDAEMLEQQDWSYCSGINFRTKGECRYKAADFDIEGDWSSAANFLVAGAIFGKAGIRGLDTASLQADISILDILVNAGAIVSTEEDGTVSVHKAPLEAFEANLDHSPDLFPITAVLAAFCAGRSRISGVGRLSGKESDRAAAIVAMLSALGVPASVEGDTMTIDGIALSQRLMTGQLLHGGKYTSSHDHRMVMALSIASLAADAPLEIDDCSCVAKSFPEFFSCFRPLRQP